MTEYAIAPATQAHAEELARVMRKADVDEVWAASRRRPLEALEYSMLVSRDTYAGLADGRVFCMFGVGLAGSLVTPRAVPWMLGAEELPKHARQFLKASRNVFELMKKEHEHMMNFVDARNEVSIRWLRWLGFDIKAPVAFGPDGLPFHPFELKREDNV